MISPTDQVVVDRSGAQANRTRTRSSTATRPSRPSQARSAVARSSTSGLYSLRAPRESISVPRPHVEDQLAVRVVASPARRAAPGLWNRLTSAGATRTRARRGTRGRRRRYGLTSGSADIRTKSRPAGAANSAGAARGSRWPGASSRETPPHRRTTSSHYTSLATRPDTWDPYSSDSPCEIAT